MQEFFILQSRSEYRAVYFSDNRLFHNNILLTCQAEYDKFP